MQSLKDLAVMSEKKQMLSLQMQKLISFEYVHSLKKRKEKKQYVPDLLDILYNPIKFQLHQLRM